MLWQCTVSHRRRTSLVTLGQIESGHAAIGCTGAEERCQLNLVSGRQTRDDRRAESPAISIGSMTPGAAALKDRTAWAGILWRRILWRRGGTGNETGEAEETHALSEYELRRKLQNARIACALNLAECRRTSRTHRQAEVCMIQQVEKLEAQIESLMLANGE